MSEKVKEYSSAIMTSRRYIENQTHWIINEETFTVLDNSSCLWVAQVTTTHNHEYGEEERTFTVLARWTEHFVLENDILPKISEWINR